MTTILVVDDALADRILVQGLLDKSLECQVVQAGNGQEAVEQLKRQLPDLIVTDLLMPDMNGFELVDYVRRHHPAVPVIIMTAHGSEEIAIQALRRGAASYVPKKLLARDLAETVQNVLTLASARREQERLFTESWVATTTRFRLANDVTLVPPLIEFVNQNLARLRLCDETGLIRVAVALREALVNAIYHGNLEVSSSVYEQDEKAYYRLIEERRQCEPYRSRRVEFVAEESPSEARYTVRDEGPGFDPRLIPDPTDPANLERTCGRGLLLIRTFMDEVYHNDKGNEIVMIKRRELPLS
ncbi:MAG: response regulator [Gemmatales bacterium]|nr:response regulator [Gemmatales bacterium]MCS7161096.1 response regulator [Gemmatales bacterium]MDW8176299.1 response regulator [Gemmatales bacterium]MDW8223195.1 response regulator [Gemmatales bacterium]